ncbi:hypothetical protein CsSME_00006524 [Camellia sinensis var. sinensis]
MVCLILGIGQAIRRTRPASVASALRDFVSSTCKGCSFVSFHEQLDPFSLVESELYILASRLRSMVVAEILCHTGPKACLSC